MADCFHDDAMILPEGKPIVKGREEIIESFKWLESVDFSEQFIIEEVITAGEYSIVRTRNIGSWKDPKTAESGNFEVKGLLVLKPDQNGGLKIYRYMFNNNGE
jgi:ketosteroid isomerase-like protein